MTLLASDLTEDQWLRTVLDLAAAYGWRTYHVDNSARKVTRRSGSVAWVRNVNVQGKGFPDLVLVRAKDGRLIFAELKTNTGHVDHEQRQWLNDLEAVHDEVHHQSGNLMRDHIEVFIWRPRDYDAMERALRPT